MNEFVNLNKPISSYFYFTWLHCVQTSMPVGFWKYWQPIWFPLFRYANLSVWLHNCPHCNLVASLMLNLLASQRKKSVLKANLIHTHTRSQVDQPHSKWAVNALLPHLPFNANYFGLVCLFSLTSTAESPNRTRCVLFWKQRSRT